MKLITQEHGFAIRQKDGSVFARPTRGAGGWSLYKTKRGADKGRFNDTDTVIAVTLTIEERITDAGEGEED